MKKTCFHFEGEADYIKQLQKEKELEIYSLQKKTSFIAFKTSLNAIKATYLKKLSFVYKSNF